MANPLSSLEGLAEGALGGGIGFGLGLVASTALTPVSTQLRQDAWALDPNLAPDAYQLAAGVAQGQVDPDKAQAWASKNGIGPDQFAALVEIANVGMPLGMAFEAVRRGNLTGEQLRTQFKRAAIEPAWWAALADLQHARLNEGAIATAVHRGIMDDSGLLVTPVPTGHGNVPRIPVSTLDTLAEFAALGIDSERARVLVADTGLPLALGEMLQLLNRGEVTETDVQVSIAESNVRNEYMDVALKLARHLLTPHNYAEGELRGILTHEQAVAGAALSGLNAEDYALLYATLGRPLNVHEITTGEARGGNYGGSYDDVPAGPYRDAIRRSAIRPEYADLAYANRYTYPSAFVLRTLAQQGDIGNEAAVAQVLEEIGWKPSFAKQVAAAWMSGGGSDSHVAKAQSKAWTEAQSSYIAQESTAADVQPIFNLLGVDATAQAQVLAAWDAIRDLTRTQLTPAKIVKAWKEQAVNAATGLPWTQSDALAALQARGYSAIEAQDLLNIG